MNLRTRTLSAFLLPLLGCATSPAPDQGPTPTMASMDTVVVVDTVYAAPDASDLVATAGRFDNGRMWTFEYPPLEYFRDAYGFEPDAAWFRQARLGALRLPNCSAGFVSSHGLVLTNHHCAREDVAAVSAAGEGLLDGGFYAAQPEDERRVDELFADQLIEIRDVTAELAEVSDAERDAASEELARRIAGEFEAIDSVVVEITSLWNGAKTSAYVFRRFTDVRLVMAPELMIGQFGGDPDNFTFPRYTLDMSFFRVYQGGEPYRPEFHFPWSVEGVEEGDAVFVIGNPGSTDRLKTVAQLEYRRAVDDAVWLHFLDSRAQAMSAFLETYPELDERLDVRNKIFLFLNFVKVYTGTLSGLNDPAVMARRRDNEQRLRAGIAADTALERRYGGLYEQLAALQERKLQLGPEAGAFHFFMHPTYEAAVLRRAFYALQYVNARAAGMDGPAEQLAAALRAIPEQPESFQRYLLAERLADFARYFGEEGDEAEAALAGKSPLEAAEAILDASLLTDSANVVSALEVGTLTSADPALQVMAAVIGRFAAFQQQSAQLEQEEELIQLALGRAYFDLRGTTEPPDATFSLRIADGAVAPYEYNGTVAPVYTTYFGLYDHHHSYGSRTDWDLPERWKVPPPALDLSTPLNFIATADIIGGNSGSPVINTDLEVVGVAFDGNIESIPGAYIFLPEANRMIAVDARGMLEALRGVYGATRLVEELVGGR